jgi:hypothetical protein
MCRSPERSWISSQKAPVVPSLASVHVSKIVVSSYASTKVVFTFGSTYATNGWFVDAHDTVTVGVAGATKTVTVRTV